MRQSLTLVMPPVEGSAEAPLMEAVECYAAAAAQEKARPGAGRSSAARVYGRNVLISVVRIGVFACAGVLLPSFLTHRMPTSTFAAWTLILQIAGYIGYLEFGIQIAVSKYVAEFVAAHDMERCHQHATAGVAITAGSASLGLLLSVLFSLFIPRLFPEMPPVLTHDVARGVLLIGCSAALMLGSSAFAGIFLGLQRYAVPTSISIANKLLYAVLLTTMVARGSSLTAMGAAVALLNTITAVVQVFAWKLLAPQVQVRRSYLLFPVVKRVFNYCVVLGLWTAGLLLISGLDTTIVGRLDFPETAYYAIAAVPLTFLSMALQAGLNPLMPAASALSVTHGPEQMGQTLLRSTRYAYLILQISGLPLFLFGYTILCLWVGPVYARHGLPFLRILVLAHILRNLCAPYATMVIAVGLQRYATWAGFWEALVNLGLSIFLGRHLGALGVALGTLVGAAVGVALHFLLSMRHTGHALALPRRRLLLEGMLQPSVALLPTILLLPLFWRPALTPMTPVYLVLWAVATAALLWRSTLKPAERAAARRFLRALQHRALTRSAPATV